MKKFSIEVVGAEGLITPKDGNGSCSPYVVIDFDDEKRKTNHVNCNQNPVWNETLSFDNVDMDNLYSKVMKLVVYHDPRNNKSNKQSRKPTPLGQVELKLLKDFVPKGEETRVDYYTLKSGILKTDSGKIGLKLYYEDASGVTSECAYPEPRGKSCSDCEAPSSDSNIETPSSPEPEPTYPEPLQQRACVNSMTYPIPQQLRLCGNQVALWIEATRWWRNPMATIFVHVLLVIYAWFPDLIVPMIGSYVLLVDVRSNKSRVCECMQGVTTWSQDLRGIGILIFSCFVAVFVLCLVPFKMVTMVGGLYYLRHPILRKHNYSEHQQLYPCVDPVMQWIEDTRVWRNPNASIFAHMLLVINVWYSSFIVPVLGLYVFIGTNINGFDLHKRVQEVVNSCQNPRIIGIVVFLSLVAFLISYLVSFKVVVMLWGFYYFRHPIVRHQLHQLLSRFG